MKSLQITIKSNNKTSIFQFMFFFNKFFIFYKICFKNLNKKRLTILKSPHVNKTAQEQFEKKTFQIKIIVKTYKFFYHLKFLKKLNFNLIADCNIYLKYKICAKLKIKLFNFANFKIKKYNKNYNFYKQKTNKFCKYINFANHHNTFLLLKLLDINGEFSKN